MEEKYITEKQIGKYYILDSVLGGGAQAICKLACEVKDEKNLIACKIMEQKKFKQQRNAVQEFTNLQREVGLLRKFKNSNIIKIYDVISTPNHIYLFMEYCNGGNLYDYYKKKGQILSENEVSLIFTELISAFKEIYSQNCIHRDIKPQNILIHNDSMKIGDFGFAKTIDNMEIGDYGTLLGTPIYLPIEILQGAKYSSKCDVFSTGIMIYELLFGKHPFYQEKVKFILIQNPIR